MSVKPAIVIVPGAWHPSTAYASLASQLGSAGYKTTTVDLPSVGAEPPVENMKPDVEAISSAIEAYADAEDDVLVFMHSYGSIPAGEAVKGLDKSTRRKDGKRGGVMGLFYCAAFPLPKGKSLIDTLGGKPLPWMTVDSSSTQVTVSDPQSIFLADVPESVASQIIPTIKPHSYKTMTAGKPSWEPYRDFPSTYLFCEQDAALPHDVQVEMIEGLEKKGIKWQKETVKGGHDPFLAVTEDVARIVRKAAGETI